MEITAQKIIIDFNEQVSKLQDYVQRCYVGDVERQYASMVGKKNWGAAKSRVNQSIKTSLALAFLESFSKHCTIEFSYGIAMKLAKTVCDSVSSASIASRLESFPAKKAGRNKASIEYGKIGKGEIAVMQEVYAKALESLNLSIILSKSGSSERRKVRKI